MPKTPRRRPQSVKTTDSRHRKSPLAVETILYAASRGQESPRKATAYVRAPKHRGQGWDQD